MRLTCSRHKLIYRTRNNALTEVAGQEHQSQEVDRVDEGGPYDYFPPNNPLRCWGGVVKLLRGKIANKILLGGKSARRRRKILRIWNIIRWRTLLLGAFQNCSKLLSIEKISLWEQGDWNFRSSVAILPCKISILDFKFSKKITCGGSQFYLFTRGDDPPQVENVWHLR